MQITDKNIILFTGNYGSGKTEIAVNYASRIAEQGTVTAIADLDLVNPYFRCREAREPLEKLGVRVVAPEGAYHSADLPILLPELRGLITNPNGTAILDVGGDNVGATVLASLADVFSRVEYEMFFVLNQKRPFTGTVRGAIQIIREVESASKMKITALAGNTHLIDETTPETIIEGAEFTREVGRAANLPVKFIGVMEHLIPEVQGKIDGLPIISMTRLLLPPWLVKTKGGMAATHARDRFGQLTS
ncbi:MAG: cobalamin biosynthesis protein CbiA [FCB group bacterium]|nr:cobalamin biosynthesis protein CbiA [FCB group bacterium]